MVYYIRKIINALPNLQLFINNEDFFFFNKYINLALQSKDYLFSTRPNSNFLLSNVDLDK